MATRSGGSIRVVCLTWLPESAAFLSNGKEGPGMSMLSFVLIENEKKVKSIINQSMKINHNCLTIPSSLCDPGFKSKALEAKSK